jgi:hypothetical protein
VKSFKVFLPHIAAYQIEDLELFSEIKDSIVVEPLKKDWQASFCDSVGYPDSDLPWTQLRLAQFDIDPSVTTACCCDPVMMQMTHRGAYMLGQNSLPLTQNDAIRIVSQINEKLMREGESLYLVDKHAWLFTCEKKLNFSALPVQELVGKDMFNYSYQGNDAAYWQQLANEIQMLLKQMIDYQGLAATPPETMMNVHFFDHKNLTESKNIPFVKNDSLTIVSDNELIKTFCEKSFISYETNKSLAQVTTKNVVVIAFDNEKEVYSDIVKFWVEGELPLSRQIICQDAVIRFQSKPGLFRRLLQGLRRL